MLKAWWGLMLTLACIGAATATVPGGQQIEVIDRDVALFWQAYDQVKAIPDRAQQIHVLQKTYLDQGSPGLAAFALAKDYNAATYVDAIRAYPRYWDSVRPRTALAKPAMEKVQRHLQRFAALYSKLKPAAIYFEIGALRSAGTTREDKVLIGVEMATGDESTDLSQMPERLQRFFRGYFASRPLENLDLLVIHETVHTQQRGARTSLLAQAVYEGVADFVAEQVAGRLPDLPYVTYGPAHDTAIRAAFRKEMDSNDYSGWLYNNTDNVFGTRDLGYYVGYAICSANYRRSADKTKALAEMIELNYADAAAVQRFVDASGYFAQDP